MAESAKNLSYLVEYKVVKPLQGKQNINKPNYNYDFTERIVASGLERADELKRKIELQQTKQGTGFELIPAEFTKDIVNQVLNNNEIKINEQLKCYAELDIEKTNRFNR